VAKLWTIGSSYLKTQENFKLGIPFQFFMINTKKSEMSLSIHCPRRLFWWMNITLILYFVLIMAINFFEALTPWCCQALRKFLQFLMVLVLMYPLLHYGLNTSEWWINGLLVSWTHLGCDSVEWFSLWCVSRKLQASLLIPARF
jgi:hypothetical protein